VRLPSLFIKVANKPSNEEFLQIEEKSYHTNYIDRQCYLIALEFSKEKKSIVYPKWEKV